MLASTLSFALLAIVAQDQTSLRAAPKDSAQTQAVLWQGDTLEVRGTRLDYWQVYDHRRERAGYIKQSALRPLSLQDKDAPDTLAVLRFLREQSGQEALGIGYAAAYLKAAPAASVNGADGMEALDALGSMAERLARRASKKPNKADEAVIAAHLEVVSQYGVVIKGFEREGRMQLCYDGDAFRRVLAQPAASNEQKARAALAITRFDCIDPALPPLAKIGQDQWRAEVLERVELSGVPDMLKNRIKMRRAGVWSAIAWQKQRKGEATASLDAGNRALRELGGVNTTELADEDLASYAEAGVRVGASRWAAEPALAGGADGRVYDGVADGKSAGKSVVLIGGKLGLMLQAGQPGETCVSLVDAKHDAKHDAQNPLLKRCTYGVVWPQSARANAAGSALTLAVQPLEGWRELWLLHQTAQGWVADVLPPSASDPELGYAEFAGWIPVTKPGATPGTSPGANKMLVAREARVEGRIKTRFEVVSIDSLQVENWADKPDSLNLFHRWQDAAWKRQTVSVR
jgi:hypothetical protein